MSFSDFDRQMMEIALTMAWRGLGTAAPNPAVGAVIADEATGEVIARAVTRPGGRPHAETEALLRAGARARGATLYVTLEPCAHHGTTPPCAEAVIGAGLRRVVVGVGDPDPRTHGSGIQRLRGSGIEVAVGVCGPEARRVTLGHILRVTERRPLVVLKMALAGDGTVPRGAGGAPQFVTGPEARAAAHLLRAESDAILVGAGTARDDDPALTCRLPGLGWRSPIRVVLSRSLDLSADLKLVRTAGEVPTWIFTGADGEADRMGALEAAGARVLPTGSRIGDVLARLAEEGVTRLLVEGGASVWRAFAAEGLADEVVVFLAGGAAQSGGGVVALAAHHAPGLDLLPTATRRVGADTMSVFQVRTPERDQL